MSTSTRATVPADQTGPAGSTGSTGEATLLPEAGGPASPARGTATDRSRSGGGIVLRWLWRILSPLVVSGVVALVLWYGFLKVFSISPLVGKTPQAVWQYLFDGPMAAANRTAVLTPLKATLHDAAIGFVAGMLAALVVALLFVLFRSVEQSLMPVAMILRSVPLIALTPLIGLIFGKDAGVAVMGGIVVFFPALVNIAQGLRSVHSQTRDLVVSYGGSDLTVMRKVGIPTALPAIFAAMRISVPGALIGALVSEWLLTNQGIGGSILAAIGGFRYAELWADIALLTTVSVVLYTLLGAVETLVLARYAPQRVGR